MPKRVPNTRNRLASALALVLMVVPCVAQQPPAPRGPVPPVLRNYQPVTAERLKAPEDGNWLMIRRT